MPDVYTTTGSVGYDTAAYDLLLRYPFRDELYFDRWADVKSVNFTHRGSSITFFSQNDLAVAATPLTEDVDVSAVPLSNNTVTVTPQEYGNAVVTTAKLQATSMFDVDAAAANVLGYNAGVSIDTVARNTFAAGTNVSYGGTATSRATVAAAGIITSDHFRRAYTELSEANVPTFDGYYVAMLSPRQAYDLKRETGELGWRGPEVYSNRTGGIANGEIGLYEGFRVVVSPRTPVFVDAGAGSTVDVYRALFMGREAIAKATYNGGGYGAEPVSVLGPVTDKLRRFQPLGWKHAVGYAAFRPEAMRAVETSSSIGANT